MRTAKQTAASRANGAKSCGPKTEAGKRRSSINARRHGLLSKIVVLDNLESHDTFNLVLQQHYAKFGPMDDVEACAIEEMVASLWRLRRLWAIEKHLFEKALHQRANVTPIDERSLQTEGDRLAAAFSALASKPELHLLGRYEARIHRMYQRAMNNFLLLREINDPGSPEPEIELQPDPRPEPVPTRSAEPAPADSPAGEAPSSTTAEPAIPLGTESAKRTQEPATSFTAVNYEQLSWEERLAWTRAAQRDGSKEQKPVPQTPRTT